MSVQEKQNAAKVLIIDDDKSVCDALIKLLHHLGHEAAFECSLQEGLRRATSERYDIVFLDIMLPDGNGLDSLPRIMKAGSCPEVIIMTGYGNNTGVEVAIKAGAWDYVQKPIASQDVVPSLREILQYRDEVKCSEQSRLHLDRDEIVGSGTSMKPCLDLLAQAADGTANVLITGETGTGKELFARAIHKNSRFKDMNCVVVDCAGLPETLIESVLFGHEKGAFTGAEVARQGLIAQAHGGTLFLDEIGELSLPIQKAFLRVLQERKFRPVGSKKEMRSNFRLVTATNRNLQQMVAEGSFRKDLLYRLNVIQIGLPPLRERREDMEELVLHHVKRICKMSGKATKKVSTDVIHTLMQYEWPGNVRELVNVLERALTISGEEAMLLAKHLPDEIRIKAIQATMKDDGTSCRERGNGEGASCLPQFKDYKENVLRQAEKEYLLELLASTKGSIKQACKISGLGRTWLYALLKKHGINKSAYAYPQMESLPSSNSAVLFGPLN